jgi:hypothetical protein
MPVRGRKPKPDGVKRNRMKPAYEWVEVLNVPHAGAPSLPRSLAAAARAAPEPLRPLGKEGLALWQRLWSHAGSKALDEDDVCLLCEQMDERCALRFQVLKLGSWHDRAALRVLDAQLAVGLAAIASTLAAQAAPSYPPATRRWWRAVSTMPHCSLWLEADWQFALDTAAIAAAFHNGNHRLAGELRAREKVMGTTADARRDLRIRYVDDTGTVVDDEHTASVTAMDEYRAMAERA